MLVNIAVTFQVPDPGRAAAFLRDALDFDSSLQKGGSWYSTNGAIAIVLVAGEGGQCMLELQSDDLHSDVEALLGHEGVAASGEETSPRPERRQQVLRADCGLGLVLFQHLDEDALGMLPPLPASLPWEPKTDQLTRELLKLAPVWIRQSARQRVTEAAEYAAIEAGLLCVGEASAMRAFVLCTLPSRRAELYAEMKRRGIDPTPYLMDEPTC